MVQQKLAGRDYEFQEPTLRRQSTVRRENLNGESHGDREEFQPEETKDDEGINEDFLGLRRSSEKFIYRHHIEPRSSTYVPREESLCISKIYIIEWNSSEKKFSMREGVRGLEKSQNICGKNKLNYIDIARKDGILYLTTTLRKKLFRWEDLKKAPHLIFFEGESKHMLSRLAAQRICETQFFN